MPADLLLGVIAGVIIGGPFAIAALWQPPSYPSGYIWISPPARDPEAGRAGDTVGTSGSPLADVPTAPTSDGVA